MLLTSLIFAFSLVIVSIVLVFNIVLYIKTKRVIKEFITPTGENQASPLGLAIDAVSTSFARSVVAQAKSQFMATQSAKVRGEAAVDGDINEDIVTAANPLLGGILSQYPALKKTLRRNPALINYALEKLGTITPERNDGKRSNETTGASFKL